MVIFAGTVGSADQIRTLLGLNIGGYINEHAATPHILPALAPHLFPDNFNRRASPRVALGVPISYRAGPTISGALTLNIGKGGVAIRTLSPLQAEARVHVKFRLPGATRKSTATGASPGATTKWAWAFSSSGWTPRRPGGDRCLRRRTQS